MPGPTTLTLPSLPRYDPTETSPNCSPGPDSSPPPTPPSPQSGAEGQVGWTAAFWAPLAPSQGDSMAPQGPNLTGPPPDPASEGVGRGGVDFSPPRVPRPCPSPRSPQPVNAPGGRQHGGDSRRPAAVSPTAVSAPRMLPKFSPFPGHTGGTQPLPAPQSRWGISIPEREDSEWVSPTHPPHSWGGRGRWHLPGLRQAPGSHYLLQR